ncbi:cyclase family protein [Amycolatopsis sp. H20-H5]|uniref:cyclase family protein n=1 Tax=Amycolatopsis sp. H20-H5 TaxID=3046309 RepID=UPI002DBE0C3E|nr:cyclase family protein [Amycolatopsis sp. H20-H5]MEC3980507.1 cyclase family protein [Amycolatopsis sp. H20-H5]
MSDPENELFSLLSRCEVIDLSVPVAEDLPCFWPGHQPFQHKTSNWFTAEHRPSGNVRSRGPYTTRWLALDEHTGTHFDAPSHFIPPPGSGLPDAGERGAITAAAVPPAQLMGPAAVLDVSGVSGSEPGTSPLVGPDSLLAWESAHGELRTGDVVLLRTGWDSRYRRGSDGDGYLHDVVVTGRRPGWPAPAAETIELLLARGVRCTGTDAPSMGAAHDPRPAHVAGLGGGMVFVEALTGLAALPARGAWFCFLPLRLEDGSGAPGRAVALRPA